MQPPSDSGNSSKRILPENPEVLCKCDEETICFTKNTNIKNLGLEETREILYALQSHQFELEMQNEALQKTGEELEVRHSGYSDFYNLSPLGYCTIDKKGLIAEANRTLSAMLGMDRSRLVGIPLGRFIVPDDIAIFYPFLKTIFDTAGSNTCELRMLKNELEIFRVQLSAAAVNGSCGISACRLVVNDITVQKRMAAELRKSQDLLEEKVRERTLELSNMNALMKKEMAERRQAEQKLRDSEEKFRRLFQYHSAVMLVIDRETGDIVDANEAAADYYGWTVEELKGMSIRQINVLPPEVTMEELSKGASSNCPKGEYQHQKKDGTIRDIESYRNNIKIGGKNLIYAVVHDVTDRKLAKEALLDNEKLFRTTFRNSPVAFSLIKLEGRICIDINQAEVDMFGYGREEVIGKNRAPTNVWDDLNERQIFLANLLKNGKAKKEGVRLRHKNGRLIIASVSANLLHLKGADHVLYASEDITERTQAEEQIKRNLLEKETLFKEIHHRVKNNLAVISSLIGLQANRIEEDAVKEMLAICQSRIKSMALVHEKLYQSENLSAINFNGYIRSIIDELTSAYQPGMKPIHVHASTREILLDIDKAIPCALIVNEMVANALKHAFSGIGEPELAVLFEKADKCYTLTVKDNGNGTAEKLDILSTKTLGLMLVRSLTRQLKGQLQFITNPADGHGITAILNFED